MDEFLIDAPAGRGTRVSVAKRLPASTLPDVRGVRAELARRGAVSPFDEVTRQNEELLQALGEVRARQKAMLALNRELEETNTRRRRALRRARRARRARCATPTSASRASWPTCSTSCARR